MKGNCGTGFQEESYPSYQKKLLVSDQVKRRAFKMRSGEKEDSLTRDIAVNCNARYMRKMMGVEEASEMHLQKDKECNPSA